MDRNVNYARLLVVASVALLLASGDSYASKREPSSAAKKRAGVEKIGSIKSPTGNVASKGKLGGKAPAGRLPGKTRHGAFGRPSAPNLVGGPDGFGYFFRDQAQPPLNFNYLDIAATGTLIVSGNNGASAPQTLGSSFDFYGTTYTTLVMSTNGYLSTASADGGLDNTNDCPLPAPPDLGGGARFYPLHDDLVTGSGYTQYFATCPRANELGIDGAAEDCTVFQWDDTTHFGSTASAAFSFQTILYHGSGVILHQIVDDPANGSLSTTGIQNAGGTIGLDYACNDPGSIQPSTAVAFYLCTPIAIAPATLGPAQLGQPYSQALTATGGTPAYTFSVSAGALPPGLALAGNVISGTPTQLGSFNFTITATDAKGCASSQAYVFDVEGGCSFTFGPTDCLVDGALGAFYSDQVSVTNPPGTYTYSFGTGNIPPGLTVSAAGVISGVATASGDYNFTVQATDGTCTAFSQQFTIVIDEEWNIVAGSGLGFPNPNEVAVFNADGTATTVDFFAYGAGQWGTAVASGDISKTTGTTANAWELITGPGPGSVYGPHVRAWDNTGAPIPKVNFFAYGTLRYGVNVGSGNLDNENGAGDRFDEIVSGAGQGAVFGPHVRGWNFDGGTLATVAKINFFAYNTLKYGVQISTGDVESDCADEIVTGPGPGTVFGPNVRGWNFNTSGLSSINKINFMAFTVSTYGANVAAGDVDADGYGEIAVSLGPGAGHPSQFRGFDYDGGPLGSLCGFDVTLFNTFFGGRVGLGDMNGDGLLDLLAGQGRDPSAGSDMEVHAYNPTPTCSLTQLTPPGTLTAFAGQAYGVNPAGGKLSSP